MANLVIREFSNKNKRAYHVTQLFNYSITQPLSLCLCVSVVNSLSISEYFRNSKTLTTQAILVVTQPRNLNGVCLFQGIRWGFAR